MRSVIAAAVSAAVLWGGPAFSAPPEREQLLEALAKAYPAGFKALPVGPALTAGLRRRLIEDNPGREAAIEPIVASHTRCMARLLDNIDFGTPMVAAVRASNLSDEDLRTVVSIYTDTDLDALLGKLTVDPPYSPTNADISLASRLVAKASDPALKRFNEVVGRSPEMKPVQTAFFDGIAGCEAAAKDSASEAGLKYSPSSNF